MNLNKELRCPNCKLKLLEKKGSFICNKCKEVILLPIDRSYYGKNTSLGEKIFDYPQIYNLKIKFLNFLNKLNIPIDPYINNQKILDIGCGSYQVRYNPDLAKFRVGLDPSVKALIHAQQLYPKSYYVVGSADKLPFANKSFDVSLLLFTLHHLTDRQWDKAINESVRVTKKSIIIYDHISHDSTILRLIQKIYWKTFDGGHKYPLLKHWTKRLSKMNVSKRYRVGSLFNHICFYKIDL